MKAVAKHQTAQAGQVEVLGISAFVCILASVLEAGALHGLMLLF